MASRLVVKEIVGLAAVFENASVDQAGHDIIYSLVLVNPPVKPPFGLGAKEARDGLCQLATTIHGRDGLGGARAIRPQSASASDEFRLRNLPTRFLID
jgi:hypothetical protein